MSDATFEKTVVIIAKLKGQNYMKKQKAGERHIHIDLYQITSWDKVNEAGIAAMKKDIKFEVVDARLCVDATKAELDRLFAKAKSFSFDLQWQPGGRSPEIATRG
jgi:hypothetical protein